MLLVPLQLMGHNIKMRQIKQPFTWQTNIKSLYDKIKGRRLVFGNEIVLNGTFEAYAGTQDDGTSDTFTSWSTAGVDDGAGKKIEATATVYAGSNAVKISAPGADTNYIGNGNIAFKTPGGNFKLSIQTRGDGACSLRVQWIVSGGTGSIDEDTGITGTSYTEWTKDVSASAGHSIMRIRLWAARAGTCYVDNVSLKEYI